MNSVRSSSTAHAKYENTTVYRVDRMDHVQCEEEPVSTDSAVWNTDVADYTERAFRMYQGEEREVTLRFENAILNAIYDKFGESTEITRVDENTCRATVKVQVSRIFWGWFFSFAEQMCIEEPEDLKEQYKEEIEKRLAYLKK